MRFRILSAFLLALVAVSVSAADAAGRARLWQIGKTDRDNHDFAFAPGNYQGAGADACFAVGVSDAKKDWPYVQPGPADSWAGGRQHTYSILFSAKLDHPSGDCALVIDLVDTQKPIPPRVRVTINGKAYEKQLPPGGGDASVDGNPKAGKPCSWTVTFPSSLMKDGMNVINITTLSGSWMLYDSVAMDAPAGISIGGVPATAITGVSSEAALVKRDGKLMQPVQVRVARFGEAANATLVVGDLAPVTVQLKQGVNTIGALAPAVEAPTAVAVTLAIGQETLSEQVSLEPVRKWVVYLLPHSHIDIGYTNVQKDVEDRQCRNLDEALEIINRTAGYPEGARFKWNSEVMWPIDTYLRRATPQKRAALLSEIKAGNIQLDALYGNELTGLCRPEEMVRLVENAQVTAAQAGVPLQTAFISDVPGYSWGLVPVFAQAGVRYFSVGPNEGDRIGRTISEHGDKPFYWISPSGKEKVLFWMCGIGYSHFHGGGLPKLMPSLLSHLRKLERINYPYDIVQVRYNVGGDNGGPDPNISDFVREWNDRHAYPKLILATGSEMFQEFEKRYADKVPTLRGDFTPYWEDGAASTSMETMINRASADRLVQSEILWSTLRPSAFPAKRFTEAWRNVILYDEHTWGAYNSISQPDAPFVRQQWAVKQAFALDGAKESKELLSEVLPAPQGTVSSVDVINTTSWARSDLVRIDKSWKLAGDRVTGPDGKPVASQRLSTGELVFVARDVPALASARYTLSAGAPDTTTTLAATDDGLASSALSLKLDPQTGVIRSLKQQGSDHEFVDAKSDLGLNAYVYLPGSNPKGAQRPANVRVSVLEKGPVVATLLVESDAPGANALRREVRLIDGVGRVDISDMIDKKPIRAKEGVHIGFAMNVPGSTMRWDTAFATVQSEKDQLPGACRNWYSVQRFIDVSNDALGMTIASPDTPLWEMGGLTANLLGSQNNPNAWIAHNPASATLYAWVMNNHWHTNYKADQEGPHTFRFSLIPHGPFSNVQSSQASIGVAQPLLVAPSLGQPMACPIRLGNPAIELVTMKASRDGRATIVRLYNLSDAPQRLSPRWAGPAASMNVSDLTEAAIRPLNGAIEMPPHGLLTLRVE